MHLYKPATVIHKVVCCSLVVFKSRLIQKRAKGQKDRRLTRQASSSKITIVSMHGHSATLSACMPKKHPAYLQEIPVRCSSNSNAIADLVFDNPNFNLRIKFKKKVGKLFRWKKSRSKNLDGVIITPADMNISSERCSGTTKSTMWLYQGRPCRRA